MAEEDGATGTTGLPELLAMTEALVSDVHNIMEASNKLAWATVKTEDMVNELLEKVKAAIPDSPPPPPPPPDPTLGRVRIQKVVPYHNRVKVFFDRFEGAKDYFLRSPDEPNIVKAAQGNNNCIEWRGIKDEARLQVVAVDGLMPYHEHAEDHEFVVLNGSGPHDAKPKEIAVSDVVRVTPLVNAIKHHPGIVYFEDFADVTGPAVEIPFPAGWIPPHHTLGINGERIAYRLGSMDFYCYQVDVTRTRPFVHKGHLMTDVSDGPTQLPGADKRNVLYGCMVAMPRVTFELKPGGVIYIENHMDAAYSGRRWPEWFLMEADKPLWYPNDLRNNPRHYPTGPAGGFMFWCKADDESFYSYVMESDGSSEWLEDRFIKGAGPDGGIDPEKWVFWRTQQYNIHKGRNQPIDIEGIDQSGAFIDNLSTFRFWISETAVTMEEVNPYGQTWRHSYMFKDGYRIPTGRKLRLGISHEAYHLELDTQAIRHYRVNTPHHDQRHWGETAIVSIPREV